ncbi:MAG: hypothetical protein ABI612_01090 [Betaproteobacteria bacterium]
MSQREARSRAHLIGSRRIRIEESIVEMLGATAAGFELATALRTPFYRGHFADQWRASQLPQANRLGTNIHQVRHLGDSALR